MAQFKDIFGKRTVISDGGMGTMLQSMGLPAGTSACVWSAEEPEKVISVHLAYLEACCEIITANTFGAYDLPGHSEEEIASCGVRAAKRAIAASGKQAFAALDVSPLNEIMEPAGKLTFEEACEKFKSIIVPGVKAGADLIMIETMTDVYQIKAALLTAKECCDLPVIVSFTIDEDGRLMNGADIVTACSLIESLGADGVGMNCGFGPDVMLKFAPRMLEFTRLPVIISPNAGMPETVGGKTVYNITPGEFAADLKKLLEMGCSAVGGCCGTTPEHMKAVSEACCGISLSTKPVTRQSFVSSGRKTVFFADKTVLIGERINPTGKKKMKEALLNDDTDYIIGEALSQQNAGADILDVNCGCAGVDEKEALVKAVRAVQSVTDLPLQIDTSDPDALERALRLYNGKPMINSVNASEKSLETVLPLAKKYGAMLVCLTLDERGIPETLEERLSLAGKIIERAEQQGIERENLIIDPLTLTISASEGGAVSTLSAIEYVRNKLNIHTISGVSNISFGLPCREKINAAFFIMAMQKGLSAGIINPLNRPLMEAYYTFNALSGRDKSCLEYIANFSSAEPQSQAAFVRAGNAVEVTDLRSAVEAGLDSSAKKYAEILSETENPLDIISNHLIPALNEVGARFESKRIFLPQLIRSANAASAAFEVIGKNITLSDAPKKAKVVLATVHGDVHDIGKNIVRALLENYSYDVIDLGRDVPEEEVLKAVTENKAQLVGLSALMTTTLPAMAQTVRLLKENTDCRIVVGGAVLTKEYADEIGADFYAKDAMCTVRYFESLQ